MTNDTSFCAQILKAKYFPHDHVLDARLGPSPSYVWRSIWSSKSLLQEGLLWRVSNGSHIKVWSDPWLQDSTSRYATSPCAAGNENMIVSDLRDLTGAWDMQKIQELFNDRDVDLIRRIPLTSTPCQDIRTWAYTKDGNFSVTTAYMIGMTIPLQPRNECWDLVWRSSIAPKIRHFLWKFVSGILPTKALLFHRHIIDSDLCPFCHTCAETNFHVFFLL